LGASGAALVGIAFRPPRHDLVALAVGRLAEALK